MKTGFVVAATSFAFVALLGGATWAVVTGAVDWLATLAVGAGAAGIVVVTAVLGAQEIRP